MLPASGEGRLGPQTHRLLIHGLASVTVTSAGKTLYGGSKVQQPIRGLNKHLLGAPHILTGRSDVHAKRWALVMKRSDANSKMAAAS